MYLNNYDDGKHLQRDVADYMWRERRTALMRNTLAFDLLGEARMRLKDLHRDNPNAGYDKINIWSLIDYVRQFKTGHLELLIHSVYVNQSTRHARREYDIRRILKQTGRSLPQLL